MAVLAWVAVAHGQSDGFGPGLIRETVESVRAVIRREYMDAGVAQRLDEGRRRRRDVGAYLTATTERGLADALTRDLYTDSGDKHLAVTVIAPTATASVPTAARESCEDAVRRTNAGVQRIEILAGNVGYLNLTSFSRLDEARDTITVAMRLLRQRH